MRTRGKLVGSAGGGPRNIHYAKITAVFPQSNSITVELTDGAGVRSVNVDSFYSSMNSGRRAMPEQGSWVILSFRHSDMSNPIILRYMSPDEYASILSGQQVEDGDPEQSPYSDARSSRKGQVPYRVLEPGEMEDFSAGNARSFASSRGRWEFWAGNVMFSMDRDDLDAGFFTPEFFICGAHADANAMQDTLRFGVVSRLMQGSRVKTFVEYQGEFPKEKYYSLDWAGRPGRLVLHQEGICLDEKGAPVTSEVTSGVLRRRKLYYTVAGDASFEHVDEKGNIVVKVADSADRGLFHLVQARWTQNAGEILREVNGNQTQTVGGNDRSTVGGNVEIDIGGNHVVSGSGSGRYSYGGPLQLSGNPLFLN